MSSADPLNDLGVRLTEAGGHLRVYSAAAAGLELCLYSGKDLNWITDTLPLARDEHGVWSVTTPKLKAGSSYSLRADGPGGHPGRFDPTLDLLDPYARGLARAPGGQWRSVVLDDPFDWGGGR